MGSCFKILKKHISRKANLGYVLVISFSIVFFSISYVTAINKIQAIYIDQVYQKGELVASSGTKSIQVFLEMTENSLLMLSRCPHIINQSTDTQKSLDEFVMDWAGTPIIGVALFDKDGVARYVTNNIGDETDGMVDNLDVNNRDYFVWAETAIESDTYLGKPLLPKAISPNLQLILPVVTPIYRNGEFDGALLMSISLPKLTSSYLNPLQVSPQGRVYLMHPDSTIMATMPGYEGLVGLNYVKYLHNNPYPGNEDVIQELKKALDDEKGGKLDIVLYSPVDEDFVRFLIVYYPVLHGGNHWTVVLAIPFDDINNSLTPFKKGGILIISLIVVMAISSSTVGTLLNRLSRTIIYLHSTKSKKENRN